MYKQKLSKWIYQCFIYMHIMACKIPAVINPINMRLIKKDNTSESMPGKRDIAAGFSKSGLHVAYL
ncbi:hypothetical protein [Ferroplasma sp.]|uniref:hypothetical protein n=1 Tax=Ferroplasma sp. TaxID=2591003 RepID=UPI0026269BAA|nr:hypothetical protein [Ferroplasma sp.]